jgi:hypothetical protein
LPAATPRLPPPCRSTITPTLDRRAQLPRYQRSAVWHGAWCHAHRRTNPARPTAPDQGLRNGAADNCLAPLAKAGMDRLLKSKTSKIRTHSLFRQGCMLYELIPTMPNHRLSQLIGRFAAVPSSRIAASATFALNSGLFFPVFDKSHLRPSAVPRLTLS